MHAIGIADRVGDLLRSEWVPLLLVNGGVCIFSVGRQLCYVEESHWHVVLVLLQYVADYTHDALPAVGTPVVGILDHCCLVIAVTTGSSAPVLAPVCTYVD